MISEHIQNVIQKVTAADAARPRSMQTEVGVSSLGACRRAVWHRINGDIGTNQTSKWAAMMGTAIHKMIEDAIQDVPEYEVEKSVKVDGLPKGTIDLWIPSSGAVIDWKTTTKKALVTFPTMQQLWQVHTYGYLLEQQGQKVNTVTLVGIPRDGSEEDIKVVTNAYDEKIALAAIAWYKDIEATMTAPDPERGRWFCSRFCVYYGSHCEGV